ncbi:MAG: hypothetical protein E5X58_31820 [Mesorhizobium sp.]|nr:MAG: hypothetical protein E5X58_31820 [Mesorhizobium sp.]
MELVEAIVERYRSSCRADKQRILDEFVAVTGYHRKHAIRVLRPCAAGPSPTRQYPVLYGADVWEALVAFWRRPIALVGPARDRRLFWGLRRGRTLQAVRSGWGASPR